MPANTGGLLVSRTITVNNWVAIKEGGPGSLKYTVMRFVDGPCASVGVHMKSPFVELITAPAGALVSSEKTKWLLGSSEAAGFVTVNIWPSKTSWSGMEPMERLRFVRSTTIAKL